MYLGAVFKTCIAFLGLPLWLSSKESTCNAGDVGDMGSIPGSGMATHSSILALKIPWMEEPGGLQTMGCKESDMTEQLNTHTRCFLWEKGTQWLSLYFQSL